NEMFYLWVCNHIEIKLGKGDRFGEYFYLKIDLIKKTGSLFVLKYWMLTLITAPLFFLLIINSLPAFRGFVLFDFEFYPLILIFSILLSIPTLLIIWLAFIALSYTQLSQLYIKLITVAFTLAGINITLLLISGSIAPELMAAYSITAVLVGLFLIYVERRKKKE
ncbi:MAG: hypothetical protein SFU21_08300, partial [Flavihumibacter sp.]|nr:hypothetical protein [Flavihumibacter sp.]